MHRLRYIRPPAQHFAATGDYGRLWLMCLLILIAQNSCTGQDSDLMPGKERWAIKTSVPAHAKPKNIDIKDLIRLPAPLEVFSRTLYNESRISDPVQYKGVSYKEGDIITTTAYIHLVALEKSEKKTDGDYHIQVLPGKEWADSCLIIEVPFPPFILNDEVLKEEVKKARELVFDEIVKGDERRKGKVIEPAAHVQITGQLFFDGTHLSGNNRGKQDPVNKRRMKSYTCWEIHPVTEIRLIKD
jgi:hypothetical protein